ncbi:condensation domain-containing protein [Alkaliphilus transvaalensis]|uniref:condensation domain-containing protein n=1 Tax=Alkaliphilus transvaalensis TaxID=114628 RepID=UPI000478D0FB|nr:condensation domain-containing protein [Alkaliphilus transvaalensis]
MLNNEETNHNIFNKIAIIGMSCRFPLANNTDEFWNVLKSSRDCVTEFPQTRVEELTKMLPSVSSEQFIREGFLENIILFEPEIFSISQEEAKYIDPQQRLLLELVEGAILDAGYNPLSISGEETGVFISRNENEYSKFFNYLSTFSMVNNVEASNAGRISYTFDFRGPSISVDAACTSSLLAIHLACQSLKTEEVNYAIAGGCKLRIIPHDKTEITKSPIASQRQKISAFDKEADGIIGGEGGGILVLKRLDKALRDHDNIIAVIAGSCVSTNGDKSNGINAPSEDMQKNMLIKAIKNARINPDNISYIEAHGSGTPLGDVLEFQAIDKAFKEVRSNNKGIAIGSVKTNLGHLDTAAGIAGMIKTILALKNKEIPASINYKSLNTEIEVSNSPVYVIDQPTFWESTTPRVAGVTSLSFIGINGHIIVEEFQSNYNSNRCSSGTELVVISARTEKSLKKMIEKLSNSNFDDPCLFSDIAYTLNSGRRDLQHKSVIIANSIDDFKRKLKGNDYYLIAGEKQEKYKKVMVIPNITCSNLNDLADFKGENEVFRNIYDELMKDLNIQNEYSDVVKYFLTMTSYIKLLQLYCSSKLIFMGMGAGNAVIDYLNNKTSYAQCISEIETHLADNSEIDQERLQNIINEINKKKEALFLLVNSNDYLNDEFFKLKYQNRPINRIHFNTNIYSFYKGMISLMEDGVKIKWEDVYQGRNLKKISLPSYYFDRKEYYLTSEEYRNGVIAVAPLQQLDLKDNDIQKEIIDIINNVYTGDYFDVESKFFDLGISSISIMYILGKVKEKHEVELPIEIFFEDITINELTLKMVDAILANKKSCHIVNVENANSYIATDAQKRIYASCQYDKNSTNYNMSFIFEVEGLLNLDKLNKTLNKLIERHEALQVRFKMENGVLYGIINKSNPIEVETIKTTNQNLEILLKDTIKPFDLNNDILLRVINIQTKDKNLLVFDIHHIISDGLSMEVLIKDFIKLYENKEPSKLKYQYSHYANWQRNFYQSEDFKKQEDFWVKEFKDHFVPLKLPLDFDHINTISHKASTLKFQLEKNGGWEIYQICEKYKITPYILLLGVYNLLLSKISLKEDITVGIFVNDRFKWGYEDIVGLFVNTLPLRSAPELNKNFSQYIEELKQTFIKVLANQDYSIENLIEKLKLPKGNDINPLFSTAFNYQNSVFNLSNKNIVIDDTIFKPCTYAESYAKFHLLFEVIEINKDFSFKITYFSDLFKQETINLFKDLYMKILSIILENFNIQIVDIDLYQDKINKGVMELFNDSDDFNFS